MDEKSWKDLQRVLLLALLKPFRCSSPCRLPILPFKHSAHGGPEPSIGKANNKECPLDVRAEGGYFSDSRIPQMDLFLLSLERRICLCCFLVELETTFFSFPLKQAWLHHSSLDCFSFCILSLSVFKCKNLFLSITFEQFPLIMSSRNQK